MGARNGDAVDAKLVGAAGMRLQLQPGELAGRVIQSAVFGDGAGGIRVVTFGGGGALAALVAADALQRQVDAALDRDRTAGDDGPVGLLHVAAAEGGGEFGGDARGAGEQQHAGGVAIQPVHQARPVARRVRSRPACRRHGG